MFLGSFDIFRPPSLPEATGTRRHARTVTHGRQAECVADRAAPPSAALCAVRPRGSQQPLPVSAAGHGYPHLAEVPSSTLVYLRAARVQAAVLVVDVEIKIKPLFRDLLGLLLGGSLDVVHYIDVPAIQRHTPLLRIGHRWFSMMFQAGRRQPAISRWRPRTAIRRTPS